MVREFRDPPPRPRSKPEQTPQLDILMAMLEEQRQTNQLLAILIEALAEDHAGDDDQAELTYMDGTRIKVPPGG